MTTLSQLECCLDKAEDRIRDLELADRGIFTVATLPTGVPAGTRAAVTDALTPTYRGTLTGGSTAFAPVIYNGTAWISA